jgi:hypothetical protein
VTGPAESITRARAALAEWNPNARRMIRRTRWLRPSRRALVRPNRIAARIPSPDPRPVRPRVVQVGDELVEAVDDGRDCARVGHAPGRFELPRTTTRLADRLVPRSVFPH